MDSLVEVLVSALSVLLMGIIGVGIDFLKKQSNNLAAKTKNTQFQGIVSVVTDTIDDVLNSFEVTIIEGIKQASEDGKVTKEEVNDIVNDIKKQVGFVLNDKIKSSALTDFVDTWDDWLELKVRAAVNKYLINSGTETK